MNLSKPLIIIWALITCASPLHAGEPSTDSPQTLYLQAGKEERSGSPAKAREIYESIIDRFPDTEFAVKANDRLLALPAPGRKAESAGSSQPFTFFSTGSPKPLPAEPLLRSGVEAARKKAQAESVRRNVIERERARFTTSEGHRFNRMVLAEKEVQWQKDADRKIVEEFGMTLDEMREKLKQICSEANVKGECTEEAFYLLSTTP